jgi:uncharacterized membrane protein YhaH (DUF805 family)
MKWFLDVLKNKYATFDGRARRSEYWYFVLFYLLILVGLTFVDGLIGTLNEEAGIGVLGGLFALGTMVPGLAVTVRRLHDINRSGWWVLIGIIPLIGDVVLIVFAAQDSQPGANKYGPNPKGVNGPGTPSPIVEREQASTD